MKKIVLTISLLIFSVGANAQIKSHLSGSIIKAEFLESEKEFTNDFSNLSFVPLQSENLFDLTQTKTGAAFLSSALVPGLGQALNGKWARAGVYFAVEALSVIMIIENQATAKRQEQRYIDFANQNWSVLAYSQWLVNYSETHGLQNGYQTLRNQIEGQSPDFNNTVNDWAKVNLNTLRSVEFETPFVYETRIASNFSHLLPNYGSQQYYELISKYYQFQSGWRDFYESNTLDPSHSYFYNWNGSDSSPFFNSGVAQAAAFNNDYRAAGNFLNLLIVNHVISAFDAYFTVKLKNSRLQASANMFRPDSYSLSLHF